MASYADDFNRADGAPGANWTIDGGTFNIASNKLNDDTSSSGGRGRYTSALDSADHTVQATVTINSAPGCAGVTARQASSTHTQYYVGYHGPWRSPGWKLVKVVAGSETILDSENSGEWGNTRTITIVVDGATQTGTMDASGGQLDGTDSAITSGSYAGVTAGWETNNDWDNWSAQDLAAPAGWPHPARALNGPFMGPLGGSVI